MNTLTARPTRLAPFVALGVAVVLALLVLLLATSKDKTQASSPLIGKVAPPIVATGYRGDTFDLDRSRGKWVVVNFFSTTCVPCKSEHPELKKFSDEHKQTGDVSLVSITFDDKGSAVRDFFEKNGGDWPVLVDDTGPIAISYGVAAVPESYLVAPSGIVARKIIGGVTAGALDRLIANLGGRS